MRPEKAHIPNITPTYLGTTRKAFPNLLFGLVRLGVLFLLVPHLKTGEMPIIPNGPRSHYEDSRGLEVEEAKQRPLLYMSMRSTRNLGGYHRFGFPLTPSVLHYMKTSKSRRDEEAQ